MKPTADAPWSQIERSVVDTFADSNARRDFWGVPIRQEHVAAYCAEQRLRFRHVAGVVRRLLPNGGRVLEVGTAYGVILLALKQMGYEVEGTDMVEGIAAYTAPLARAGVTVHAWDIHREECPAKGNAFDVVIASEVLEHLQVSLKTAVEKLMKPLGREGWLVVTTPNIYRLNNVVSMIRDRNLCERFPDEVAIRGNVIVDDRCHPREPTKHELIEAFKANAVKDISSTYFDYYAKSRKITVLLKVVHRLRDACLVVGRKAK